MLTRYARRRYREHPARSVAKWERKERNARANADFQKMAAEHPELSSNPLSRIQQKWKQKRKYAKEAKAAAAPRGVLPKTERKRNRPLEIGKIETNEETRFRTGISELDRVLGGGAVHGSFVLVGGEPGIGKSTLLLQMCQEMSRQAKILYVSGEESLRQIRLRADRLHISSPELFVLAETYL